MGGDGVRCVRFSWVDVSGMVEPRLLVTDVEAETLTKAMSRVAPVIPQPTERHERI